MGLCLRCCGHEFVSQIEFKEAILGFGESISGVKVLFSAERIVLSGEIVEGLVAFGGRGVGFLTHDPFKDEGGGHIPAFKVKVVLSLAPGIDDCVVHVRGKWAHVGPSHRFEDVAADFVPFVNVCIVGNVLESFFGNVSYHKGGVETFVFEALYLLSSILGS